MTYAILYLEINLFSIALLLFIRVKNNGISQMFSQRNFSLAVDSEVAFILSDTVCVMILSGVIPGGPAAVILFKSVYFFSTALMCYFWFIYFEYLQASALVKTRFRVRVSSVLVWIMAALLCVNLFTGVLFYVDAEGKYQRGPLFALQYLISYAYVFVTCFRALIGAFQKEKRGQKKRLIALAMFPVAPAIAGIIQFIHPELPVACAALSLAALFMYQMWLDQIISLDPLTQLNNRNQLTHHYEHWKTGAESDIPYCLLLIDVNRFKSINDTYGHIEGDQALLLIADTLRFACADSQHRCLIARYGGDEFVIFAREEDRAGICGRIEARLAEAGRGKPYALSVSVGAARARKDAALQKVIEEADAGMYREKKKQHGP